jgi:PTS system cellobiose-specific IIA component
MKFDSDPEDVQLCFQIIVFAGNAKTEAYKALEFARNNNFEQAAEQMKKSQSKMLQGHKIQTQLLSQESDGVIVPINMILIHAQDTLMTAMSECNLIEHMIELYQRLSKSY